MDIPLKHVIGTIALIGLVIAAGLSYTIITSYIETEVTKQQLNQIAENVALNLIEIITLVNFANYTGNVQMKILELPSDLGGKAYTIQLINETSQNQGCYVQTQLVTRKDITAKSLIPVNSTQTHLKLVTDEEGTQQVRGENTKIIYYSGMVYGGTQDIQDIVVWAWKESLWTTWVGIGLWKSAGG